MKIAINSLSFKDEAIPFYKELFSLLKTYSAEVILHEELVKFLGGKIELESTTKGFSHTSELAGTDFMFSIGGDGTLLDTVTYIKDRNIPILGINTGRLGFLAASTVQNIDASLRELHNKTYRIEDRILLHLDAPEKLFGDTNFALNDFSILKRDTSSMIIVHTYINGEFLNSYWADGILVCTPTGSTAYSLSCGGPVVLPNSNNFVISPVCPHNLNVRPLVVPDTSVISFKIEGRTDNSHVSLDSRNMIVSNDMELSIRKESFAAKIITTKEYNYFNTLRSKLSWGSDIRN